LTTIRLGIALLIAVCICLGAAGVGSLLTSPSLGSWYASLAKPRWTPPNWVFAPVWTTLYLCMAVAAWCVWRNQGFRFPLVLFLIQLGLNVLWSGLFFALRRPGAAVLEVVFLWAAIFATDVAFWPVSRVAGALMLPYLVWVTFASGLNAAVWKMNP